MSDDNVLRFPGAKGRAKLKARGATLCRHGHHQWEVVTANPFAVKIGKLVTTFTCRRCGATKNELR